MKGPLAEFMVMVDPEMHRKHVTHNSKGALLYVKMNNALYGLLKSALLFCKKVVVGIKAYDLSSTE